MAAASASGVPGRHEHSRPVIGHELAEAAGVAHHHRLAEREAGEQHARHVHAAVRKNEHVGASEERRQLRVAHVALHEAHPASWSELPQALHRHAQRAPHHPQLGVLHLPERLQQHVHALVGPHNAEIEHHRPFDLRELAGQRTLVRLCREVLERSVRDHMNVVAAPEQLGTVSGVHDHGVHFARQAQVDGLVADHVVHREHLWTRGGEQVRVDALDRQPLEMPHVRRLRVAPVAQHVRHVLRELHGAAAARRAVAQARGEPVERLAHGVAERHRRRPVHEARGHQLHVHAAASERGGQRVVVGDHVGGWVDQVHSHAGHSLGSGLR